MWYKHLCAHLVKQCDVEREPEAVPQVDFVRQGTAELLGCGGRVRQKCFGRAVHERHWQHDGLLRLGGLDNRLNFSYVCLFDLKTIEFVSAMLLIFLFLQLSFYVYVSSFVKQTVLHLFV